MRYLIICLHFTVGFISRKLNSVKNSITSGLGDKIFQDVHDHNPHQDPRKHHDNEPLHDHPQHGHDHDHVHRHHHHDEAAGGDEKKEPGGNVITEEVEEIIKEERKLSRKFSGIADILERKMAAAGGK